MVKGGVGVSVAVIGKLKGTPRRREWYYPILGNILRRKDNVYQERCIRGSVRKLCC